MCATTGLRHGGYAVGVDGLPFAPFDERENAEEIADWWERQRGEMKITGRKARNLNPLIVPAEDVRALKFAWWWLWTSPDGPVRFSAFNARDDRLTGPAWSRPFQRRALIPANWYVEKGVRFEHPTGDAFGIAAITNTVREADGTELLTYAMVTRDAVGEAADTWNRMPLVLSPEDHDAWLDPHRPGDGDFAREIVDRSAEISRRMTVASAPPPKEPPQPTLW